MTRFSKTLQSVPVIILFVAVTLAQQASPSKPANQPLQGVPAAGDRVFTILAAEPARAALAAGGPLVINIAFDPPVPPIGAGNGAVRSGNLVTITTTAAHGLSCGSSVTINGVADPSFDGTFPITVFSTTGFTYPQNGPDTTSGGGTVTVGGATTLAEQAVVQQAINDWQALVQDSGSTTNPYPLTVRFTPLPNTLLGCTIPVVSNPNGNLLAASMAFNSSLAFWEDPVNPPPNNLTDLLTVVRHELGHALGWASTARTTPLTNTQATGLGAAPNGAVRLNNVVTITTTSPHGLSAGQDITLAGVKDNTFNGDYQISAVPSPTTLTAVPGCVVGAQNNAASGGGSVTLSLFDYPRLNIPFITGSGMHPDEFWRTNDLMVPCTPPGTRRAISLYPDASLAARGNVYVVPMQFVDPTYAGQQSGSVTQPWQTFTDACIFTPVDTPVLLSNATHIVPQGFDCVWRHLVNAARGGAFLRP